MGARRWTHVGIALVGSLMAGTAGATQGPLQNPLRVTQMYTVGPYSAIYVAFQPGAMPGCYGNAGGYLYTSNSLYKEIYAQLLMMTAMGGIRAIVVYTQNAVTNNWGDCTIDGIFLQ